MSECRDPRAGAKGDFQLLTPPTRIGTLPELNPPVLSPEQRIGLQEELPPCR